MYFLLCQMVRCTTSFFYFVLTIPLSFSGSVQEPSMQSVQISNSGQQVDACAGTNGGVHSVIQYPQTAARAVHSGGHE